MLGFKGGRREGGGGKMGHKGQRGYPEGELGGGGGLTHVTNI